MGVFQRMFVAGRDVPFGDGALAVGGAGGVGAAEGRPRQRAPRAAPSSATVE